MVFPNVDIKTLAAFLIVIPSINMHLTFLFNLSIITIILIQFFPQKSRLTGKSIIKSIEIWNHFYPILVKIWKHRGIYFLTFCFLYTHNNFLLNVWRHLLSQTNNNNGLKFRMFLFYLGALQLDQREIFG